MKITIEADSIGEVKKFFTDLLKEESFAGTPNAPAKTEERVRAKYQQKYNKAKKAYVGRIFKHKRTGEVVEVVDVIHGYTRPDGPRQRTKAIYISSLKLEELREMFANHLTSGVAFEEITDKEEKELIRLNFYNNEDEEPKTLEDLKQLKKGF